MSDTNKNPEQIAYERIREAGQRLPLIVGDLHITFELNVHGILLRGRITCDLMKSSSVPIYEAIQVIPWLDLSIAVTDPFILGVQKVTDQLAKYSHGRVDHADS